MSMRGGVRSCSCRHHDRRRSSQVRPPTTACPTTTHSANTSWKRACRCRSNTFGSRIGRSRPSCDCRTTTRWHNGPPARRAPDRTSRRLGDRNRASLRLFHQPGGRRGDRRDRGNRAAGARLHRRREHVHPRRTCVPARSWPASRDRSSRGGGRVERQRIRRPDVSARRRGLGPGRSELQLECRQPPARFPARHVCRHSRCRRQCGLSLADRAPRARAWDPARFCARTVRRRVCRRRQRVDAELPRRRRENVGWSGAVYRYPRRIRCPVHGYRGARRGMGPRRRGTHRQQPARSISESAARSSRAFSM